MKYYILTIIIFLCLSGVSHSEDFLDVGDSQDWYTLHKSDDYGKKTQAMLYLKGLKESFQSLEILEQDMGITLGTYLEMFSSFLENNPRYFNDPTVMVFLTMCQEKKLLGPYQKTILNIDSLYPPQ